MASSKTFSELYQMQIYAIFGKEFYKHAIFLNYVFILMCGMVFYYVLTSKSKADKFSKELTLFSENKNHGVDN